MHPYAAKLMQLHNRPTEQGNLPSAIFGTAGQLARSLETRERVRMAVWPCLSTEEPAAALGLMSALIYFLDSWRDIRIYPLLIKLDDAPGVFEWTMSRSQFTVDDWSLDDLDDNAALWGTLESSQGRWTLSLTLEDDLTDEDSHSFSYTADDLAGIFSQLPAVAEAIAMALNVSGEVIEAYDVVGLNDTVLISMLRAISDWQIGLLLSHYGLSLERIDFSKRLDSLLDATKGRDAGAWLASSAFAHGLLPGYGEATALIARHTDTLIETFPEASFPSIYSAAALFRLALVDRAYTILEAEVEAHPQSVASWLTLADLYRRGGRIVEMVDAFQRAIEEDAVNVTLYRNYATVLELINDEMAVQEFVLIDPDEYYDRFLTWEAIAAYDEARQLQPDSVVLLQRQTQLLIDVADGAYERFIGNFKQLLEIDTAGDHIRAVCDQMELLDDLDPVLDLLEEAVETSPDRVDLHINLAVTYLANEDYDLAAEELEEARGLTQDAGLLADIDRLMLSANDPDFEAHLGEIEAQVDGGARIDSNDIEFLEDIIDQAPSMAESYVLLGKALMTDGDLADALDILLDGHEQIPDDLDIITLIGQVLWESGEHATAFEYMNKGLELDHNHVPLLAQTGQYLFEDGQEAEARAFLARAEAISPRHRALAAARRAIADMLNRED
ncbi:MAG: tetratricopeptide repeat protein [Chloroflexota bacterium]